MVAFLIMTTAYSVLLTWVFLSPRSSVLIATLFHGAINVSQGLLLAGTDPASRYWVGHGLPESRGPSTNTMSRATPRRPAPAASIRGLWFESDGAHEHI